MQISGYTITISAMVSYCQEYGLKRIDAKSQAHLAKQLSKTEEKEKSKGRKIIKTKDLEMLAQGKTIYNINIRTDPQNL